MGLGEEVGFHSLLPFLVKLLDLSGSSGTIRFRLWAGIGEM